ncbi:hypothetical protein ACOMHN_030415 [Nucella lapillus]
MWSFFIAASCLLAICQGQFRPPSTMGGAMAPPINGMMGSIFRRGPFSIDFNKFNSLEGICSHAFRMKGNGDHLSDLMRTAVQYKMRMGANPMTLGGSGVNSGKWNCLLNSVTRGWTDPNGASNGVGDYFDTAAELRIQPFLPFQFNPCTMVFCGEQGMTPMAMVREVMMRLQMGRPLGAMANVFGQHAAKLASRARAPPMGAAPGGMMGTMGMRGVNPMQGMSMMRGGMPNMPRMPTMPGMANMQQMMKMMSAFGAGAAKVPSTNAVSSTRTGTDPSTAGISNTMGNTVMANQSASAPKPAPSSAPSTSPAVSNTVPSGNMMANALKAMTGGMGGGMGIPGMGMPGMGMAGMGMPGMGMAGMGMPGMSMTGMGMPGMGMPGMGMPGMGMPRMGMGMPGMGGMGGMGGMLGAMMMGEYLMDMPDPPAYGMRGGYGMPGSQMGMGGMPGMSGMPGMPAPAPAASVRSAAPMYRSPMPARLPPPPPQAPMAAPAQTPPSGMGALADIFKALG